MRCGRCAPKRSNIEFASVCVNSFWTKLVAGELRDSPVKVCTVAGFPLGATSTPAKVAETLAALRDGAEEIDMVINIGALRGGETGHRRSRTFRRWSKPATGMARSLR